MVNKTFGKLIQSIFVVSIEMPMIEMSYSCEISL